MASPSYLPIWQARLQPCKGVLSVWHPSGCRGGGFSVDLPPMAKRRLYCQQCGRHYPLPGSTEGKELFCAACGGGLADRPAKGKTVPKGDAFRGKVISGARLTARLAVRPTRVIYRAAHKRLRTDVRVEVFPGPFAERNSAYVQRLFRQAAVTREIRSLNVVTMLDLGRRTDYHYIMTDHLPSGLRSLLEKKGRVDLNMALVIAEDALRGLTAVDTAGATHGNVSPDGVLFDYDGSARLDHLGTALRPEELNRLVVTEGGMVAGPVFYIAPERTAGERQADIRSDLYSLGVTMYQMLSGRLPYDGRNAEEVAVMHVEAPVPELDRARPDTPPEISRFIGRLMAKDPADRPEGPEAALEELRERAIELSSQRKIRPVQAAGPSQERAAKSVKWGAAWTVVALLLFGLAVVPLFIMYRQHREKQVGPKETEAGTPPRVLMLVRGGDPLVADPLPAETARAVRTLIAYGLSFCRELDVVDPAYAEELHGAGKTPQQIRQTVAADYLLVAAHTRGFQRRNWTLTFAGGKKEPWSVRTECGVEEGQEHDLSGIARALEELLAKVTERLELDPPGEILPVAGADAAAWAQVAAAVEAEREGRWKEAVSSAQRALDAAPDGAPFAVLLAFYNVVDRAKETGRFPRVPALPTEGLSPEMVALAGVLTEMGAVHHAAVERRFGDYLSRFPRSARGYFLLALWRLYARGSPEEAAVSLKHAVELDPGFMPAAFSYLDVLAKQDPGRIEGFLADYKKMALSKDNAYRLARYAEELLDQPATAAERPDSSPQ